MSEDRLTHSAIACGMASLWGFFFSGRLFPVSLAAKPASPSLELSLYILFGATLVVSGALLFHCDRQGFSPTRRRMIACLCSVLGAAGSFALVLPNTGEIPGLFASGISICLIALYLMAGFWYWAHVLQQYSVRSVVVDSALSVVLFCLASLTVSLVRVSDPMLLALLPLASCTCIEIAHRSVRLTQSTTKSTEEIITKRSTQAQDQLTPALLIRILLPCVVYFCLTKTMNIALDFISLMPMDSYRPAIFLFAALGTASTSFALIRDGSSSASRLANAFSVVSACLLATLFFTCSQTMGLLPLGNYALVIAKILVSFFIWLLIMLIFKTPHKAPGYAALSCAYLVLILWLPNFVHSALLSLAPAADSSLNLSGLFVAISMMALFISIMSSIVIASFITRPKANESQIARAEGKSMHTDQEVLAPYTCFKRRYDLSDREIEIVQLACSGKTAKRIARELFIAESTVYTHLKNIYRKADVHSKQELVDLAETIEGTHTPTP